MILDMFKNKEGKNDMSFTVVRKGGFDQEEVMAYIEQLEDTIDRYKEKDNSIKNAIVSAQIASDNMIKNAKEQAKEYRIQIARELENIRTEIERERFRVQEFQDMYEELIRKHLTKLNGEDFSQLYKKLDDADKMINHLMQLDLVPGGE